VLCYTERHENGIAETAERTCGYFEECARGGSGEGDRRLRDAKESEAKSCGYGRAATVEKSGAGLARGGECVGCAYIRSLRTDVPDDGGEESRYARFYTRDIADG